MRAGCAALFLAPLAGSCQIDRTAEPDPINVSRPQKRDAAAATAPPVMEPVPLPPPPPVKPVDAAVSMPRDAGAIPDARPPRDSNLPPPPPFDAAAPNPAPKPTTGSWWKPTVGMTWDWQLRTPINPNYDVQVYDIDLFDNDAQVIADLHARGRKVICYVNLGAWENWRADADRFPKEIIGTQYKDFPDENWLDIRQISILAPLVRSRLDMARNKGCDAVEPDNLDGYDIIAHNPTGFPLTHFDQLNYNRFVAAEAHARGLAVGLKNDVHQIMELVADFDFHVSEQCYEYGECPLLMPFIAAGKPIFLAEYALPLEAFCAQARAARISAIKKTNELDSRRELCP